MALDCFDLFWLLKLDELVPAAQRRTSSLPAFEIPVGESTQGGAFCTLSKRFQD
jgi:hypothetical protein